MARPDFRAAAARRLSEDRELSPAIISLLSSENAGRSTGIKVIAIDRIESNPRQPRTVFDADALSELAASIREHGVLQPILVRPLGENRYQLVAGERRWRASREAGLASIPALVEELDDDTALEISIIENLQREDLSPLEEATMFDRMVHEHGYSIRKLAEKLGKDKGYLENRLRLANASPNRNIDLRAAIAGDHVAHAKAFAELNFVLGQIWSAADCPELVLTIVVAHSLVQNERSESTEHIGHRAAGDEHAARRTRIIGVVVHADAQLAAGVDVGEVTITVIRSEEPLDDTADVAQRGLTCIAGNAVVPTVFESVVGHQRIRLQVEDPRRV